MGQGAGTRPVASRDKDVESRLARQNQPFFRKPKATRSGVRSFTGFPLGCYWFLWLTSVQLFAAGAIFDIDVAPGNDYANALPLEQTLVA